MRPKGIFINGVYEGVLNEILVIQTELPDQVLFLQPYSSSVMVELRDNPPALESPLPLYISVTTDLPTVRYKGEIVGWDDKRELSKAKRKVLERLLWTLQPHEGGLYDMSKAPDGQSANLLYVRRLQRLEQPFSVSQLEKFVGGGPVSANRTTAGGWTYLGGNLP